MIFFQWKIFLNEKNENHLQRKFSLKFFFSEKDFFQFTHFFPKKIEVWKLFFSMKKKSEKKIWITRCKIFWGIHFSHPRSDLMSISGRNLNLKTKITFLSFSRPRHPHLLPSEKSWKSYPIFFDRFSPGIYNKTLLDIKRWFRCTCGSNHFVIFS